jgi:hypothetical protein
MNENTFVAQLEALLKKEGFLTRRELGVGYGVADLVIVKKTKLDSAHCRIRTNHKQFTSLLKEDYFKILKALPDEKHISKAVDFNYIVEKTGITKSHLKYQLIRKLIAEGYIKTTDNQMYFKVDGWLPIAKEVIAIEAKLKDWKRGALQANRYKAFANKVFLAIPKETAHLVDKEFLRKHNIGLISMDTDKNTKRILINSQSTKPLDEYKFNYATEYFWQDKQLVNFA